MLSTQHDAAGHRVGPGTRLHRRQHFQKLKNCNNVVCINKFNFARPIRQLLHGRDARRLLDFRHRFGGGGRFLVVPTAAGVVAAPGGGRQTQMGRRPTQQCKRQRQLRLGQQCGRRRQRAAVRRRLRRRPLLHLRGNPLPKNKNLS